MYFHQPKDVNKNSALEIASMSVKMFKTCLVSSVVLVCNGRNI